MWRAAPTRGARLLPFTDGEHTRSVRAEASPCIPLRVHPDLTMGATVGIYRPQRRSRYAIIIIPTYFSSPSSVLLNLPLRIRSTMPSSAPSAQSAVTASQGVTSTTWTAPPFFGDLTIPELYAFHAEKSPNHPVIAFDEEDGSIRMLTYTDVFRGIRKAAGFVSGVVLHQSSSERHVVGILAIAGERLVSLFPRMTAL